MKRDVRFDTVMATARATACKPTFIATGGTPVPLWVVLLPLVPILDNLVIDDFKSRKFCIVRHETKGRSFAAPAGHGGEFWRGKDRDQ
jgi:hypothetical protein